MPVGPAHNEPLPAGSKPEVLLWSGPELLMPRLRMQAAELGVLVCDRLRRWNAMEVAVEMDADGTGSSRRSPQLGPGLARGWSGLAVLFEHADRCRPGEGWAEEARDALGRAAQSAAADPSSLAPGLAAGWAGVAFASAFLARGGQRYGRWRRELVPYVERSGRIAATAVENRRGSWPFSDFDHISGLAGLVAGLRSADSVEAMGAVTSALVHGTLQGQGGPLWGTAPDQIADEALRVRYRDGLVNLGLAHGLAGVVAALALAVRENVAGCDGEVALDMVTSSLASAVRWKDGAPTLPHFLSLGAESDHGGPGRTAWCYGPPGAARALALAGSVLRRPALVRLAGDLLVASLAQPENVTRLDSPTFCHGVAGVLQLTARMAVENADPRIADLVPRLCGRLLDTFVPNSVFGFRNVGSGPSWVDEPGLLEGAAGVGLVLLSIAHRPEPGWDQAFLLS